MLFRTGAKAMLLCFSLFGGLTAFAQYSAPATPAPYNPIALAEVTGAPRKAVQAGQNNYQTLSQNPYLGGVPSGRLSAAPMEVSLGDAVTLGLKQNLGGVLATDAVIDARGEKWQALSDLLPNVVTDTGFGVHQINVKAEFGLTIPKEPPIIGPFGYFDSRAYLTQSVFDWASIERARSSQAHVKAAEFSSKDARELVVLVIVSNYLLVIADQSEVESATSQRDTAKALFQQASDQKAAGLSSAVDVLRSQVQLQSREQKLISAQNNLAKQKLVLARAIGLPLGQQFEITTHVHYQELTPSSLDDAIQSAYKARADFQSQVNRVRSAELARKAASAERYPSIGAETDYGLSGVNPGSSHGTVDAAATLHIPIFQGGRVHGDVLRADASLNEEKQRLEDLRARIDQDVRDAHLDLEALGREVSVEKSAIDLASTRAKSLSALADVKQKRAAVEQAQLNLGYTKIFAPVTGEVTKKVVVGLNVDPGEQLLTVVPLDQVWITANFKETQLKRMRVGQKASIELDSNGRTYNAHVDSIAGGTGPIFSLLPPENATGNYVKIVQRVPVKIVLEPGENRDHQLRPGMNVEAKVYLR